MRFNVVSYYSVGRIISKKIVFSNAGLLTINYSHVIVRKDFESARGSHRRLLSFNKKNP